jgi:hypothetical protein
LTAAADIVSSRSVVERFWTGSGSGVARNLMQHTDPISLTMTPPTLKLR